MKNIGTVKSLVFGGHPHNGAMQAIGGTKGEGLISSGMLPLMYQEALEVATNATQEGNPTPTDGQLKRLKEIAPVANEQVPLTGLEPISVNFLNGYRPGQEHMPLQFIYEPPDYRLFYTWENLAHPATARVAAAGTFWSNGLSVKGTSSHAAQHHCKTHPCLRDITSSACLIG
ncbi:peptidase S41 family protein [Penicillium riverlandense]|uniref:peptidase S41 family protein n=1 Tax=Penicillium riverlandense TaxID=1903569 RepID=UPI0025478984|nr:peptidase S41 family protein [Penicillium riverlandense]KAJ5804873.1 peptidase S41 family protein [Penicillium riverlandense]